MKYRALEDMAPTIKKGDIAEFTDELDPRLKGKFAPADADETTTHGVVDQELDGNISRDDLKIKATELGIDFAGNISTAKLLELVKAKMAENKNETETETKEDEE
jgi:hypothetical protein